MGMAGRFIVTCACGQCLDVGAELAGTFVTCDCGAQVVVPSLSKLRVQSGVGAYESGALDTVRRMLASSELPHGTTCALSGEPTDDVLELTVVVSNHLDQTDQARFADRLVLADLGLIGYLFRVLRDRPSDYRPVEGTEIDVPTPLRLEACHHRGARKARQDRLKAWLRTVPIYAALLDEYPYSRVVFPDELG
jgi:hypothetical protein